jgi:hypothetical protein
MNYKKLVTNKACKKWWSLTESNRRHPACKAGALPSELRPRYTLLRNRQLAVTKRQTMPIADYPKPNQNWWAWEDLNFRPHAYQARALTN